MTEFCARCGTQVVRGTPVCPNCGQVMNPSFSAGPQTPGKQNGYLQPAVPQQYAQPAVPQQYAQPAVPQQYAQPAVPQQYAQPAVPQQYAQQVTPQQQYAQPGQYGSLPVSQPASVQPQQQYLPLPGQQAFAAESPYAQPPGMMDKRLVLNNAPMALNRPDQPWQVTTEGDSIVARWKWMDATFFSPHEINDETRAFTFTVTLYDNGTYREIDVIENKSSGVKMSGGKLSFGSSSSSFKGKTNKKSFSFGAGQNNQTGQAGLVGFKFNTTSVKQPVRDYLFSCGWKKS